MYSLSASLANNLKMRSKTPLFAHRLKRWYTMFQSPKPRGQITPRDSRSISVKNRINEQPVVCGIAAHMTFSAGQKIFDPVPLVVSQSKALHGRPPQSRLPMNHSTTDLGIPKVTPGSGS